MSVRRCHRSVVAVLGLAVILLAAYAVQMQSGSPAVQAAPPYIYHFPQIYRTEPVRIQGTVTNQIAAAEGETISLMVSRDGGLNYSEVATTVTAANGTYQFDVPVPVTNTTDRFYAAWKNRSGGRSKLWSFNCNPLTTASPNRTCDFNIQDVTLYVPVPDERINFPYTFRWSPRTTASDNYAVAIFNDDANKTIRARSDYVGYTDRVTISVAPGGSTIGARYYWSVRIQTPSGQGDAYTLSPVFYNDLSSVDLQSTGGPGWVTEEGQRE